MNNLNKLIVCNFLIALLYCGGGFRALADVGLVVAASNSSAKDIALADYRCDGTNDQVEIQVALDAAGAVGGEELFYAEEHSTSVHQSL